MARSNRRRLKPSIALKLGCTLNKSNRYRLSEKQLKQLHDLSQGVGIKRLFFDIETSRMTLQIKAFSIKYEQRISYKDIVEDSKIICISYKWEGEDKVHNLRWDKNHCDKELLKAFIPIMNEADEVIGHNGDNFDIKIVRTRAIYHRLPFRVNIPSLDTLKKARSYFRFPNNKLDTIAHFLGVGAKIEHEGIRMWEKVERGDKEALDNMVEYCDMDVVVLEDCYTVMENYVKHNHHAGVADGGYKHECPVCGSEEVKHIKNRVTAAGTLKRLMQCNSCDYDYEISNSAFRTMLELKSNIIPQK
jgi:uncharacterized protein YprB with RNaseH-like and TPR domain